MVKNKYCYLCISLWSTLLTSFSQNKFWITFKDKNNTPFSLSNPTVYLSPASVQRRQAYGIAIDSTDLPVNASYIQAIDNLSGVTVLYASRWMNAVTVSMTNTNALNTIQTFSFVKNYAPVNRFKINIEKEYLPFAEPTEARTHQTNYYGYAWWQTKMLNADCLHNGGYRGQGMKIAVLDAGFYNANNLDVFDSLFARGGVLGTRDFVSGGTSVYEDDSHGTSVLSCMAGLWPNTLVGTAPRADYWLLRTEDVASETPSEEYNWIRGAEFADSVGCDILTTSLGYSTFDNSSQNHTYSMLDGKTIPMSRAATMAARKGMLVLNSAGNEGGSAWNYITVPADADSIVTVGAVDSLGNAAFFSSKGPTADGRIKPDLTARGASAAVVMAWSNQAGYSNGTSFSCPILAGAMACFWQKHKTFHPVKVIDTLKKTASLAAAPNNTLGWGIPNMCSPLSVKEWSSDTETRINIFPNPASERIFIECPDKNIHVMLYNSEGKTILELDIHKNHKTEIPFSEWPRGLYFLRISGTASNTGYKISLE